MGHPALSRPRTGAMRGTLESATILVLGTGSGGSGASRCVSRGECRQCVNSWRKEGPRETIAGGEDDWEEVDRCFRQAHAPAAWWRAASTCRDPKALSGELQGGWL